MSRREEDLKMLNTLLNDEHAPELTVREVEAFADMRFSLIAYKGISYGSVFQELTEKQRDWVRTVYALRVGEESLNLVSRGLVPRGKEVAPAPVLRNLPMKPPPLPQPSSKAPMRSSRRHCGNEENGCYAFVNGDCACDCCRR